MRLLLRHKLLLGATPCSTNGVGSSRGFRPQANSPRHGLGADLRKTNKYKEKTIQKKNYKFWTEPRPYMVLGLKPMGKPSTQKKNYKFWTEPRPCMVLGLKPMGKPSTQKKTYKFWTEPRPCMVLELKPMGKPSTQKKNYVTWTLESIRGELPISSWVNP